MGQLHIVGMGGTTRPNSSTEKALRVALRYCEELGASTRLFAAEELAGLPLYAPEHPERADAAKVLISELRQADGVIVGSPGYHGSVSGLVKNALDYVEDMKEDNQSYFSNRPVGCIATGAGWQGTVSTLEHLRTIVHALRGWPTPLGAAINTTIKVFDDAGSIVDERVAFQVRTVAEEVMAFATWRSTAAG